MADIIDDFLSRLKQSLPDAPPDVCHKLETGLRQSWGGAKPYVAKFARISRSAAVARGLRQAKPLKQIFAEAGVSRRTGYRLLNSK